MWLAAPALAQEAHGLDDGRAGSHRPGVLGEPADVVGRGAAHQRRALGDVARGATAAVGGGAGRADELHHRGDRGLPDQVAVRDVDGRACRRPQVSVVVQREDGPGERLDVTGRDGEAQPLVADRVTNRVALRRQQRQVRPDAVADAGPQDERPTGVTEPGLHADVGLDQEVGAAVVGGALLDEHDMAAEDIEVQGGLLRALGHARARPVDGGRQHDQAEVRAVVGGGGDGADEREGVLPVLDAPRPGQHEVVGADAGHHPAQCPSGLRRRRLRDARRHDGEQAPQGGVGIERGGVHAPEPRQLPQPEVALLAARADDEVGATQMAVQRLDVGGGDVRRAGTRPGAREVRRVVQVQDHGQVAGADLREAIEHEPVADDDIAATELRVDRVGGRDRRDERGVVPPWWLRAGQGHVVVDGELPRHLPRADAAGVHLLADLVGGDEQHPGAGSRVLVQVEGPDELLEGLQEVRLEHVGTQGLLEQPQDRAVADHAALLDQRALGGQVVEHQREVAQRGEVRPRPCRDRQVPDRLRTVTDPEVGQLVPLDVDAPQHAEDDGGREDPRELLVGVVLVDRREGVALQQVGLAGEPEALHRAVVAVIDPRRRHVAHAVPQHLQAPAEVDVLEEREVAVVEPADVEEGARAHDHRPAGGEQRVPVATVAGVVELDPAREAVAVEGHLPARVVHGHAVLAQDLAGDAGDGRFALQLVHGGPQPGGVGCCVVVEQRQIGAGSEPCPLVDRRGEPGVGVVDDDLDLREGGSHELHRAVRGGVVDEDDLDLVRRVGLRAQRSEALLQVAAAVVVDDDDRDGRPGARGLRPGGRRGGRSGHAGALLAGGVAEGTVAGSRAAAWRRVARWQHSHRGSCTRMAGRAPVLPSAAAGGATRRAAAPRPPTVPSPEVPSRDDDTRCGRRAPGDPGDGPPRGVPALQGPSARHQGAAVPLPPVELRRVPRAEGRVVQRPTG
jgi:hypothetical protein